MKRIYPPIYRHLWEDGAEWYLENVYSEPSVRTDLEDQEAPWWLVKDGEATIGTMRLRLHAICPARPGEEALLLHRIYLDPEVIGRGIGRQLMILAEEIARSLDKEWIWLEAMDSQESAIRFYEKAGFSKAQTFRLTYQKMHPHLRGMFRMMKQVPNKIACTIASSGKKD